MLRRSPLALLVPLAAMPLSDLVIGFDDWRMTVVVYAALTLPALIGMLARRYRLSRAVLPSVLASSLIFFVTTKFAVWAFGGLYSPDVTGLMQCYVAGLPFLKYTVAGDLFWAAVLFGGAFLVHRLAARKTSSA
jgi:ammonia channel protein AmtB